MNSEISLAIRFQADDEGLDRIVDMLASKAMQFTGGGCSRIILGYDNEDEEIPPVLEPLLSGLVKGGLDFGENMVGYIRNKNQDSVTTEQAEAVESWFAVNVENFKVGNLVDLWEGKG